jgi:hypothetical protein
MHNFLSAVSRRKAGLAAGVVLAGGLAGGVLFTPGTAFASTTTSTTVGAITSTHHFNGSWSLYVPVTVAGPGGGTVSPDGTVTVSDGSQTCGITLAANGTGTSGGACSLGGLSAGAYSLTAKYSGSTTTGFGSSVGYGKANIGTAPAFTADSPSTSAANNQSYSYNFNASGDPAPAYSLGSGSAGWMSINTSTGVVSGTVPAGINSFSYSVIASNNVGSATAGPFTVQVSPNRHGNLVTSLSCTSRVHSGSQGTCTLDVTNDGNNPAPNVEGQIKLPSQLKADFCGHGWGWGWYNSWGCSISGNTATQNLGTLRPGQTRTVTVTFTAQSTRWLWGGGRQYREWVRVGGSAESSGYWGWFGGNSSHSTSWVQILPPRFWW